MSLCRSCGAEIFWAKTTTGRNIPLDADKVGPLMVPDGNLDFVDSGAVMVVGPGGKMRSHFATCPNAAQHRTRK
jgi:hypothetical protein